MLYTTNEDLLSYCVPALKTMSVYYVSHGIGKILEGTTRGLGKHLHCTGVIIVSFYFVSLPVIFKSGMNTLSDIWLGPVAAGLTEVLIYLYLLLRHFNYDAIQEEIDMSIKLNQEELD